VNLDDGSAQIQKFDACTGEACGEGTIRALASQFVVAQRQCAPASYVSLQVLKPARGTYTSGSVAFDEGDGNALPPSGCVTRSATVCQVSQRVSAPRQADEVALAWVERDLPLRDRTGQLLCPGLRHEPVGRSLKDAHGDVYIL